MKAENPPKKRSSEELKEIERYAFDLWARGTPQKEISRLTQVSEKSISKWANDPEKDWEGRKTALTTSKGEILRMLYNVLKKLNELLMDDKNIGDTKLADAYVKYTASIKNLETETNTGVMIETGMLFIRDVQAYDLELAKTLTDAFNAFIMKQLKRFK